MISLVAVKPKSGFLLRSVNILREQQEFHNENDKLFDLRMATAAAGKWLGTLAAPTQARDSWTAAAGNNVPCSPFNTPVNNCGDSAAYNGMCFPDTNRTADDCTSLRLTRANITGVCVPNSLPEECWKNPSDPCEAYNYEVDPLWGDSALYNGNGSSEVRDPQTCQRLELLREQAAQQLYKGQLTYGMSPPNNSTVPSNGTAVVNGTLPINGTAVGNGTEPKPFSVVVPVTVWVNGTDPNGTAAISGTAPVNGSELKPVQVLVPLPIWVEGTVLNATVSGPLNITQA